METFIVAAVVGIIFAFIITGYLKGQLKTVRKQDARSYQRPGSFNLVNSSDLFLYRHVTKIKIEKNNK